jgi:hypothetical protein
MHKIILFTVALMAAGLWGCGTDIHNGLPHAELTFLLAPSALLANVDTFYTYAVRVTGEHADSVFCEVRRPDGSEVNGFTLFDDGNTMEMGGPSYASPTSGDIAANNGTFTRSINSRLLADGVTGSYHFTFLVMSAGGTGFLSPPLSVQIENVSPCEIVSWPPNDSFAECFAPIDMEVRVARDSSDRVDSVWMEVWGSSRPEYHKVLPFAAAAGDTVWRRVFNPTAFSCAESSPPTSYTLYYFARTRFGLLAEQTVTVDSFTNSLPILSNPVMPDTTYRPAEAGVVDTITVTVDFSDCELAGEIHYYGLHFDRSRDDTLNWSTDPSFFLRDDGLARDAVAGDGRYTVGLTITRSDTLLNNLYYFRFYAVECAPGFVGFAQSAYLLDSMRVIQTPGGAPASAPSDDFGMGIVNEGFRP